VNHGIDELRIQHMAVLGNLDDRAFREAIHVRLEGANAVGKLDGQHRENAIHKVGGITALDGLLVHRRARLDVVGNVRDVDF